MRSTFDRLVTSAVVTVALAVSSVAVAHASGDGTSSTVVVSPALTGLGGAAAPKGGILPASLFDPTRFSITNTMSFGYSSGAYGGRGGAGLFVSSLGYKLAPNMALHVNVGANLNPAFSSQTGLAGGIFLEGATFDWRPSTNSLFRVEYKDIRSPLQSPYGLYGSPYGSGYGTLNPGPLSTN